VRFYVSALVGVIIKVILQNARCKDKDFLKRFIAQIVYTVCTRINYKIVNVNNLSECLQYGTSGIE